MPFTFAHPAAVLPLRKYCPKFLNLAALMVGSLMPDLGYFMHNWVWSLSGHAFAGSVCFDIPAGLIVLTLFYLSVRPVARLLPYPHREACSEICPVLSLPGPRAILVASVSLLMGAWTHIIWDGFTHENGWCVRHLASVTPTLFMLGSYPVTVWHLLQHGSTVLGLFLLAKAYLGYAHGRRFLRHQSLLGPATRLLVLLSLLAAPAMLAIHSSVTVLNGRQSLQKLDVFAFQATVNYVTTFLVLLCSMGVIVSVLEYLFLSNRKRITLPAAPLAETERTLPIAKPTLVSVLSAPEVMPMPVESFSHQASVQ